jgi:hypothetical protein
MTIGQLKELIKGVPDDFEFEVDVSKRKTDVELNNSTYPYPFDSERCPTDIKAYDIGWSEKKMKIDVTVSENNYEIHVWTTPGAAGYKIVNKNTGEEIEMNQGCIKSSVIAECKKLSKVTGMKVIIDKI